MWTSSFSGKTITTTNKNILTEIYNENDEKINVKHYGIKYLFDISNFNCIVIIF